MIGNDGQNFNKGFHKTKRKLQNNEVPLNGRYSDHSTNKLSRLQTIIILLQVPRNEAKQKLILYPRFMAHTVYVIHHNTTKKSLIIFTWSDRSSTVHLGYNSFASTNRNRVPTTDPSFRVESPIPRFSVFVKLTQRRTFCMCIRGRCTRNIGWQGSRIPPLQQQQYISSFEYFIA